MKKQLLLFLLLGTQIFNAQTLLLQESFETDGEGTRYTSNTFQSGCDDFFTRMNNTPASYCLTTHPTNPNGTFYWGGEDTDQASNGEGVLTLNPIAVTGYNVNVDILLAVGRPNDFRLESDDYFILEYNMDGAGWNIFGALYGNNGTGNGNLQNDSNLDGTPDSFEINSSNFINANFTIPVTGNSLQIRMRLLANTGTEEIVFDNIRINGTVTLGIDDNISEFKNVFIYPNPSNGLVNVNLGNLINPSIKIYNTLGQLIYSKEKITNTLHKLELKESNGLYFVEISSQNKKHTYKLIKK